MVFLSSADGDVGDFLSCLKGVKDPFGAQKGRWGFSRDTPVDKGLSSCGGGSLLVPRELRWGSQRTARGASGRSSLHASREGPLGIPLQSLPRPRSSSGVEVRTSGFLSRVDLDLGVPLRRPEGSQDLLSCGAMQVHSPLKPEKQCQASCWVDHRDRWLSLEAHKAVTPAIVF